MAELACNARCQLTTTTVLETLVSVDFVHVLTPVKFSMTVVGPFTDISDNVSWLRPWVVC